jgi:hypothetical protein
VKPTTVHDLIATHRDMLDHLAFAEIESEPAAFVCQLGEIADRYSDSPTLASAVDSLSAAVTCLTEALDRPDGSAEQAEFLQAADRHLYNLAAHALA